MRYSTGPRKRKYVKGYGFLSFAKRFQKAAEATRDLIGSKIADKITSASKTKSKGKKCQTNEMQKIYIPQEKTSTNQ